MWLFWWRMQNTDFWMLILCLVKALNIFTMALNIYGEYEWMNERCVCLCIVCCTNAAPAVVANFYGRLHFVFLYSSVHLVRFVRILLLLLPPPLPPPPPRRRQLFTFQNNCFCFTFSTPYVSSKWYSSRLWQGFIFFNSYVICYRMSVHSTNIHYYEIWLLFKRLL